MSVYIPFLIISFLFSQNFLNSKLALIVFNYSSFIIYNIFNILKIILLIINYNLYLINTGN